MACVLWYATSFSMAQYACRAVRRSSALSSASTASKQGERSVRGEEEKSCAHAAAEGAFAPEGIRSAMNGLQEVRFAKTDTPAVKRGRRLERVDRPGTSCENRRALRLPIRAAKNWRRERTSRRYSAGETAACVAEVLRAVKPHYVFL